MRQGGYFICSMLVKVREPCVKFFSEHVTALHALSSSMSSMHFVHDAAIMEMYVNCDVIPETIPIFILVL